MEIAIVTPNCIKVKGKRASLVIDPSSSLKAKIPADGVVLFNNKDIDATKIEGSRIVIKGPGEYEISGIKVTGLQSGEDLVYTITVDGVQIVLAKSQTVEKIKEKVSGSHISLLLVTDTIDQSLLATLEPRIAVLYGETVAEKTAGIDSEIVTKAVKVTTTADKLPEKMEVVILS